MVGQVETYPDGYRGLIAVAARPPAVVVLDMKMPVMDGWAYCDRLARQAGPRPPIIVVSAAAIDGSLRAASR